MRNSITYDNDPLDRVSRIKEILADRYKSGFPIIKEIIQNANDGGAKRLDFGIIRGLGKRVSHPLLRDPALFFLNDGSFNRDDEKSIIRIGVDANAGDTSKIGKFGLGQKSIFHFCEAFFYMARSEEIPEGSGSLIDPWAEGSIDPERPEWTQLTEHDFEAVRSYLIDQDLIQNDDYYFLLWVPLRQVPPDDRYIVENYYENPEIIQEQLQLEDIAIKIGQILPSLRYLNEVHYWLQRADRTTLEESFKVIIHGNDDQPLKRCRYPKNKSEETVKESDADDSLRGSVTINPSSLQLQFAGKESVISSDKFLQLLSKDENSTFDNSDILESLRHSKQWPKRISISRRAERNQVPDKALPHSSVIFSRQKTTNEQAKLTLQWAVFLPVSGRAEEGATQQEFQGYDCKGDYDYSILLHGYFFLDPGRKYIHSLEKILKAEVCPQPPENFDQMYCQWNNVMATEGTLRLILPALSEFVSTHELTHAEVFNLCEVLSKEVYIFNAEKLREYLYADYQWSYRLDPAKSEWLLLDSSTRIRSLPSSPPWNIFPALKQIAEQEYLTLGSWPNLRYKPSGDAWTGDEISNVLSSLKAGEIFSRAEYLDYLVQFLQHTDTLCDPSVQNQLHKLIIDGFRSVKLSSLEGESICPSVQSCIKLLDSQKWFKLKRIPKSELNNDQITLILESLFKLDLSCLLVYEPFEPKEQDNRSVGTLDDSSIVCLLEYIAQLFENPDEPYQRVADHLIDQFLKPEMSLRIIEAKPNLKIFRGYNYQQQQYQVYSYHELKPIYEDQKSLFGTGKNPAIKEKEIAKVLQEAITDRQIVVLPKTKADLLKQVLGDIPQCDRSGCAKLIGDRPTLSQEPSHRQPLLKELSSESGIDKQLRYLLHSNAKQYEDTGNLYVIPTDLSDSHQFWETLGKQVLAKKNESWRLLNQDLVNQLLPATQNRLGIKTLQAEAVIEEIERDVQVRGVNCLDTTEWQDADYDTLLGYLYTVGKETLWKQLPLHKTEQGDRVSINDRTFRTSDTATSFSCPSDLAKLVTLIPLSDNQQVQRGQKDWIPEWSPQKALEILLEQKESHTYGIAILNILEQVDPEKFFDGLSGQEAKLLTDCLKQTAWLPTQLGNGISPNSIVRLPKSLPKRLSHDESTTLRSVVSGHSEEELSTSISKTSKAYKWLSNHFQSMSEPNILKAILGAI